MGKLLRPWQQLPLFWRVGLLLIALWLVLQTLVLPGGLVAIYMVFAVLGVFLYVTVENQRIRELLAFAVDERPWVARLRLATLIAIPVAAGGLTLRAVLPSYAPPSRSSRSTRRRRSASGRRGSRTGCCNGGRRTCNGAGRSMRTTASTATGRSSTARARRRSVFSTLRHQ